MDDVAARLRGDLDCVCSSCVCVFITAVPITADDVVYWYLIQ
jgi:hypothetical protein